MAVVSTLSVTLDTSSKLKDAVRRLLKQEVLVGIPDSTAERQPAPGEKATASNALIGYVQEFGSDEHNIPPRPFLVPGVQDAKDLIVKRLQGTANAVLSGDLSAVDKGFQTVGLVAQNAVRAKIAEGPFTPLAKRTLEARRAKGRTGDRPLIDTGKLREAITYVVRDKGAS